MRNAKFWDECTNGSIRQAVAAFIDNSPLLSHYKGEKYYALEDEIVAFLEQNKETISREVDKEYQRDDILDKVVDVYGDCASAVIKALPVSVVDEIISNWQDAIECDDVYWERTWESLEDVLGETPLFDYLDDYTADEVNIYCAYLKDWYSCRQISTAQDDDYPVNIDDFYNFEMLDEGMAAYYTTLACGDETDGEDDKS